MDDEKVLENASGQIDFLQQKILDKIDSCLRHIDRRFDVHDEDDAHAAMSVEALANAFVTLQEAKNEL